MKVGDFYLSPIYKNLCFCRKIIYDRFYFIGYDILNKSVFYGNVGIDENRINNKIKCLDGINIPDKLILAIYREWYRK